MRVLARFVMPVAAIALAVSMAPAQAQIPCHQAHQRVNAYYWRVKAFADGEAYHNIPMRCGPDIRCGNWWIAQLNAWLAHQVRLMNTWHAEIQRQCRRPIPSSPPSRPQSPWPPEQAPQSAERPASRPERTVTIEIPTTPQGYVP